MFNKKTSRISIAALSAAALIFGGLAAPIAGSLVAANATTVTSSTASHAEAVKLGWAATGQNVRFNLAMPGSPATTEYALSKFTVDQSTTPGIGGLPAGLQIQPHGVVNGAVTPDVQGGDYTFFVTLAQPNGNLMGTMVYTIEVLTPNTGNLTSTPIAATTPLLPHVVSAVLSPAGPNPINYSEKVAASPVLDNARPIAKDIVAAETTPINLGAISPGKYTWLKVSMDGAPAGNRYSLQNGLEMGAREPGFNKFPAGLKLETRGIVDGILSPDVLPGNYVFTVDVASTYGLITGVLTYRIEVL